MNVPIPVNTSTLAGKTVAMARLMVLLLGDSTADELTMLFTLVKLAVAAHFKGRPYDPNDPFFEQALTASDANGQAFLRELYDEQGDDTPLGMSSDENSIDDGDARRMFATLDGKLAS